MTRILPGLLSSTAFITWPRVNRLQLNGVSLGSRPSALLTLLLLWDLGPEESSCPSLFLLGQAGVHMVGRAVHGVWSEQSWPSEVGGFQYLRLITNEDV